MADITQHTGVVFFKITEDKEISIENVTALQVRNNGVISVFVNGFEIASKETFVLVVPDGTQSDVLLDIRFGEEELTNLGGSSWNKQELDIIYKRIFKCKN